MSLLGDAWGVVSACDEMSNIVNGRAASGRVIELGSAKAELRNWRNLSGIGSAALPEIQSGRHSASRVAGASLSRVFYSHPAPLFTATP